MADEDYNDFDGGDVGSEEEPPKPEIEEEVGAEEEENEEIGFIEEIVFDRRDAFPFRILVEEKPPRNEPRKTPKFMTKDERAEILDTRVLQIRENAPVMVELEGETDPFEIATRELREGRIRFTICRTLPDGSCEYWRVDELFLEEGVDELIVEDSRRRQVGGD